jgi:uncharacterized protein (TIGR03382 family)
MLHASTWTVAAAAAVFATAAQASLVRLDSEQVLDEATQLVWLYDWGMHGGSWQSNSDWAAALDLGGHTDWALPRIDQFQDLWAHVGATTAGLSGHFANVDPYPLFSGYWSSTTVDSAAGPRAYIFVPQTGGSYDDYQFWIFSGVAVRPAPEPGVAMLLPLALAACAWTSRRRSPAPLARPPSHAPAH